MMKKKKTSFSMADVVVVVDCHCRFSICRSSEITRGEEATVLAVVIAEVSSLFFSLSLGFCLPLGFLPRFLFFLLLSRSLSRSFCELERTNNNGREIGREREREEK